MTFTPPPAPGRPRPGRTLSLALLVLVAPALSGCDSLVGAGDPGPQPPTPITELPRALSAAEVQVIQAGNSFGFDLLRRLADEKPDRTVFVSPLSASMALGMALNGADGATFDGMREALHLEGLDEEGINAGYRDLLDLLEGLDPEVELGVANAVWHRTGIQVLDDYRTRVQDAFDARIEGLDFSDPGAAARINGWVRDATNGRIDEMVTPPIPGNMVAYLLNAVYFKGGWTEPFDPDLTRSARFRLADGNTAPIDLMMRDDTIRHRVAGNWAAADLPYAGGAFAMTVVVPAEGVSLDQLLNELTPEWWGELVEGLGTSRALVSLPRFELEWEGTLNDVLEGMGMAAAFDPGQANFSRMFQGGGVWIDEVKQKSFLRVDEEGTEAAAATSVSMPSSMPPEIRADRPFLLAIRERLTGSILFVGAIREAPAPAS
ncbi:MAG: serpin family protein [Gemmatimonadales bacterium]|nr:MAG: serpin family protein [Gemmatimonadales bacterium]